MSAQEIFSENFQEIPILGFPADFCGVHLTFKMNLIGDQIFITNPHESTIQIDLPTGKCIDNVGAPNLPPKLPAKYGILGRDGCRYKSDVPKAQIFQLPIDGVFFSPLVGIGRQGAQIDGIGLNSAIHCGFQLVADPNFSRLYLLDTVRFRVINIGV